MDDAKIYERLSRVFEDVFDEEPVLRPELSAKDVEGWDSLTHVRLMLTVQRAFKIEFTISEIGKMQNVGDLVRLIKERAVAV
jgi:acyl carrier protein